MYHIQHKRRQNQCEQVSHWTTGYDVLVRRINSLFFLSLKEYVKSIYKKRVQKLKYPNGAIQKSA